MFKVHCKQVPYKQNNPNHTSRTVRAYTQPTQSAHYPKTIMLTTNLHGQPTPLAYTVSLHSHPTQLTYTASLHSQSTQLTYTASLHSQHTHPTYKANLHSRPTSIHSATYPRRACALRRWIVRRERWSPCLLPSIPTKDMWSNNDRRNIWSVR